MSGRWRGQVYSIAHRFTPTTCIDTTADHREAVNLCNLRGRKASVPRAPAIVNRWVRRKRTEFSEKEGGREKVVQTYLRDEL